MALFYFLFFFKINKLQMGFQKCYIFDDSEAKFGVYYYYYYI